eukprot:485982-Pyramimonas_sp.AAC.1
MVYKHRMCFHLVKSSRYLGNPRFYWTYVDEGANRALAPVAKSVHHGSTFYFSVLEKLMPAV